MTKCLICGEEIQPTDKESVYFELHSLNSDATNCGNICGDCFYSQDMKLFKLWRRPECTTE